MIAQFLNKIRIICLGFVLLVFGPGLAQAVDIQQVTSPNGIKALLVENYNSPLITISFSFVGGVTLDPVGKEGITRLLSTMLDEGAGQLDSQEFQSRAENLGAELSFRAGRDSFTGRLQTLSENSSQSFELLRLALNEPRFDEKPMERMRQSILTGLKRGATNPNTISSNVMRKTLFQGHAYQRPRSGTEETVKALTPDDLRDIRKKLFVRDRLIIGVVGAINAEKAARALDFIFAQLPQTSDQEPIGEATPVFGRKLEKSLDIPQAIISFALPGLKRSDPDFFAAYLANHILGGGTFSSRLYQEVREKRGLAYSVYSQMATYDHGAVTMIGLATSAERADQAIAIVRDELTKMAKDGPTADELAAAKKYVIGSYAIRNLDTSSKVASVLVAIQQADLGIDYIDRRADIIGSVTLEEVKKAAARLLNHEPTLVVVGPDG